MFIPFRYTIRKPRHDRRIIRLQTPLARCCRSLSWYAVVPWHYQTLRPLAIFICRFPRGFQIPFTHTIFARCVRLPLFFLFWGFWASVNYTFARTLQTLLRKSYHIFHIILIYIRSAFESLTVYAHHFHTRLSHSIYKH